MKTIVTKLSLALVFCSVLSVGALQVFADVETCLASCEADYNDCTSACSPFIGEGEACLRVCRKAWIACQATCGE